MPVQAVVVWYIESAAVDGYDVFEGQHWILLLDLARAKDDTEKHLCVCVCVCVCARARVFVYISTSIPLFSLRLKRMHADPRGSSLRCPLRAQHLVQMSVGQKPRHNSCLCHHAQHPHCPFRSPDAEAFLAKAGQQVRQHLRRPQPKSSCKRLHLSLIHI